MINIKNEKLDIVYYPEDGVVSFDIGTLKQFSPKSWPFNCYYERFFWAPIILVDINLCIYYS